MARIPLFGLGIASRSPTVTAKLLTNFYAEQRPQGEKSMMVAYGTPGLELFDDFGANPSRGGLEFEKNNVGYVVNGNTLWEVDANGVNTNRGTLLTSSGRVSMAHNGVQVMIVDGTYGYIYNTVTVVFAQITDPDFPANPTTVTYLSQRFEISVLNSSRFYTSDIDDGLSWDALFFANAETNPDPIVAVWASNGQIILEGSRTAEFWGNSGTLDFPFTALQGTANEWGLAAVWTIAKYDNTFACLMKNRMGQVMVAQMNGYLPKKISTVDLDHIINGYTATADASAYSYMLGGHPMYVINFPSAATDGGAPTQGSAEPAPPVEPCVPEPPDPMPDRVLYLGVDSTVANGAVPIQSLDSSTKWVWTVLAGTFVSTLHVDVVSDVGVQVIANFAEVVPFANGANIKSIAAIESIGEVWVLCSGYPLPTSNRHAHIARFTAGVAALDGTASVVPTFIGWELLTDDPIDPTCMAYDPVAMKVWIAYSFSNVTASSFAIVDPATIVTETIIAPGLSIGTVFQFCFASPYVAVLGSLGPTGPNFLLFNAYTFQYSLSLNRALAGKVMDYDSVRTRFIVLQPSGLSYTLVDAASGATVDYSISWAVGHDTVPPPNSGLLIRSMTYYSRLDLYIFGQNSSATQGSTLYIVDPSTLGVQSTYTYETGANNLLINTLLEPETGGTLGNYVLGFDLTHVKRLYFGEPCSPEPPEPPEPPSPGEIGEGGGDIDGATWLYDGSTGMWSKLKSLGITRHRAQFSFQLAGMTIVADYANGKLYRLTDTALTDNGDSIEGEIIGETVTTPDLTFIEVDRMRVDLEAGVGLTVGQGSNPQVALSISRDNGKTYGPDMWRPMGAAGEFRARVEWRRLGTTRYFTPKLRITDPVKRVIVSACLNPDD